MYDYSNRVVVGPVLMREKRERLILAFPVRCGQWGDIQKALPNRIHKRLQLHIL